MASIRVFLLDDQAILRAGFRSLLNQSEGVDVVGECGDAREAVSDIERLAPDVILLDITMPGLSGIDAIPLLRRAAPQVQIVMLTHHEGQSFVDQALRLGASGYISKDSDPEELSLALRSVMKGETYISPKVTGAQVDRPMKAPGTPGSGLSTLTPREREVFQLLALGHSNKEVANSLGMSLGTAKKHRENLQRKLEVGSTAELARLAIREGLLSTD